MLRHIPHRLISQTFIIMRGYARLVPKVVASISAFGVILLFFAFASSTGSTWGFTSISNLRSSSIEPQLLGKLALAEKLWGQAVKGREQMIATVGTDRDFPDGYINPYHVWDFARPSFFCPYDLERVGKLGDGGKVVCGMSRYENESPGPSSVFNDAPELVVYSFGVNRDSSFEAALLERTNAQIWGYDYSVSSWANDIPEEQRGSRAHFSKFGIGRKTDKNHDPPFYTVQDLMKTNGHDHIDIVKMDIEGAEFDAMTSLIEHTIEQQGAEEAILPFGQLLVEIHFFNDRKSLHIPEDLKGWTEWWSAMEKLGLRPVNNEDNWIGDAAFGKPRFMEVNFPLISTSLATTCLYKHLLMGLVLSQYTLINVLDFEKNKLLWK